jgi:hypothetical protein
MGNLSNGDCVGANEIVALGISVAAAVLHSHSEPDSSQIPVFTAG